MSVVPPETMMRSKVFCLLLLVGGVAFATSPHEVYQHNEQAVLATSCSFFDGIYFVRGEGTARMDTPGAKRNMREKARLDAYRNLMIELANQSIRWPELFSDDVKRMALNYAHKLLNANIRVSESVIVHEETSGLTHWLIVAFPKSKISGRVSISFEALRAHILDREALSSGRVPPYELLRAMQETLSAIPEPLEIEPWMAFVQDINLPEHLQKALPKLVARFPLGTTDRPKDAAFAAAGKAFSSGDLNKAYDLYLESLAHGWSYDAFNMAGNVARRIQKQDEAILFLLHAAYLKPTSPHPWVHLAYIAEANGSDELLDSAIQAAEMREVDEWTSAQLDVIRRRRSEAENASENHEHEEEDCECVDEAASEHVGERAPNGVIGVEVDMLDGELF